jgi:sulfoxide reductase heme-binding subunit YedZ
MELKNMFGKIKLIVFVFLLVIGTGNLVFAQEGALKDSDFDGVSDESELNIYKTDINNPDTDGDGILDYQEILDRTDPTNPGSNKLSLFKEAKLGDPNFPLMWTIGKTAGIASFIMFTLVIVMGLTMTSKILLKYRIISPPDVQESHMLTATFIAFFLVILHFGAFLFDDFVGLRLSEVFIPFLFKRRFIVSGLGYDLTLPVGLGIISFYISIILLASSHLKNKLVSAKNWRILHYSSFLFYILFLVHSYMSGSDSDQLWLQLIYIGSLVLVIPLVLIRIFAKNWFLPKPKPKPQPEIKPKSSEANSSENNNLRNVLRVNNT